MCSPWDNLWPPASTAAFGYRERFWHDRKPPKPIGESSTYQGQGVALWADGSTHYQYLGLNTLTNETETLEE